MGFSQSWLGVKRVSPRVILEALALCGTGGCDVVPDAPLNGVGLPGEWYLVIANNQPPEFFQDSVLQRLSADGEVVICFVEEHVMYSSATGWKNGRKAWSVLHDSQRDVEHLEAAGDLPSIFASIRDRLRSEQKAGGGRSENVDFIFDVPVDLAEALTGYRYNADIPALGERPFEALIPTE